MQNPLLDHIVCCVQEFRTLGIHWDVASYCILFSFAELAAITIKIAPTKRNVVSVVSWFYEPLGLVTPVTTHFKIFTQELCEAALD